MVCVTLRGSGSRGIAHLLMSAPWRGCAERGYEAPIFSDRHSAGTVCVWAVDCMLDCSCRRAVPHHQHGVGAGVDRDEQVTRRRGRDAGDGIVVALRQRAMRISLGSLASAGVWVALRHAEREPVQRLGSSP